MSSSLNSSALARAAEQTAKANAQAMILRKTDGDSGMLVSGDAFAQVFAQADQKPAKPRTNFKAEDNGIPTDRTPKAVARNKPRDDNQSCERADAPDDTAEASEKESAKPKLETRTAEKKDDKRDCSKSKDDKKTDDDTKIVSDAASQQQAEQKPTDTVDVTGADMVEAMADQATPDTNDAAKAAAAFSLPATLKAQEAASGEASTGDKSEEQEGATGNTAIADLISFRANTGTRAKTAGKDNAAGVKPDASLIDVKDKAKVTDLNASKADGEAKAEAKPELKTAADVKADVKAELPETNAKADVKTDFTAALKTETAKPAATQAAAPVTAPAPVHAAEAKAPQPQVTADATLDASVKITGTHETSPKKDFNPASSDAAPKADAPADTQVSQSPPAAGGRVNALMGFSAPLPPTGPGSGSPPSAKAAGGTGVDGVTNIGALNTSARIDGGAVIQLAKAMKTDGTVVSSPAEQVSVSLSRTLKNGGSSFEVQLTPAELGKVEIKIDISKDGVVNAVVTSDNPATHDLLQKDAKQLEKVFQQAGLNTDSGSLNFQLRGEAQQQQQANQQDSSPWKRWMDSTQKVEAAVATKTEFYSAAPGRVDMMI